MQRPRNSILLSEWMSNQLLFSYYNQLSRSLSSLFISSVNRRLNSSAASFKLNKTEAKSEPGLTTIDNQVVFLHDISNRFNLIPYIKLNWA